MGEEEAAKAKGNAAFSCQNYLESIKHYTEAISISPTIHVLYSNRSIAHASVGNFSAALFDAEKTVSLKPDWVKGYFRLGRAHSGLGNVVDAISAYKKGLEIDPGNAGLKSRLEECLPFGGPDMWNRLAGNPSTKDFLLQPDYVRIMSDIQKDVSAIRQHLRDARITTSIGFLFQYDMAAGNIIDGSETLDRDFPKDLATTE